MRRSSSSRSDLNSLPDTPESPKRLPEDPEPPSSGVGVPPEQLHGGDGAVVHEGTQRTGRVSTGRSGKSKRVLRAERRLRAGAGTPPDGDRLGRVSPGGLSPGRLSGRGSPVSPIESALGEVGRLWGVLRQELARETPYVPGLSIHTPKRRWQLTAASLTLLGAAKAGDALRIRRLLRRSHTHTHTHTHTAHPRALGLAL